MHPFKLMLILGGIGAATLFLMRDSGSQAHAAPVVESPYVAPLSGPVYVKFDAPCAKDEDANIAVARAIRDKDQEAMDGLLARDKIFILKKGTRFDVSDDKEGFAWGFVRSGRNTGENCYILGAALGKDR